MNSYKASSSRSFSITNQKLISSCYSNLISLSMILITAIKRSLEAIMYFMLNSKRPMMNDEFKKKVCQPLLLITNNDLKPICSLPD